MRTSLQPEIATTGVRTGLAMTDRVTYYVIARALAPVAISYRYFPAVKFFHKFLDIPM